MYAVVLYIVYVRKALYIPCVLTKWDKIELCFEIKFFIHMHEHVLILFLFVRNAGFINKIHLKLN